MNEIEFIRKQLATERSHRAAVRAACAEALSRPAGSPRDLDFLLACADYLVYGVGRSNAQDQAHCELLRVRLATDSAIDPGLLTDLEQLLQASRRDLEPLASARAALLAGSVDDAALVAALRVHVARDDAALARRRHALQHLLESHYGITDWRRASAVDADAIVEERERYSRVSSRLPEGIDLAALGSEASTAVAPAAARETARNAGR